MIEAFTTKVEHSGHKFSTAIDPETGRIANAVPGNAIFGSGGKDNNLGAVGKVVLDNLLSHVYQSPVTNRFVLFVMSLIYAIS